MTRRPSPGGWPRSGTRSRASRKKAGRPGAVDEVRARHEAETKRMWLPKGKENKAVPGSLFSGHLRAFPGIDIMMARSHEV